MRTLYYLVRMPPDMPYEIRGELNAWYVVSEPVMKCRDCKHFGTDTSDHEYRSGWWCGLFATDLARPNAFCAWGERREDA